MKQDLQLLGDAEAVTTELAAAGLRRDAEPLRLLRAWPDKNGGLVALYVPPSGDLSRSWYLLAGDESTGSRRRSLRRGHLHAVRRLGSLAGTPRRDPKLGRLHRFEAEAGAELETLGIGSSVSARIVRYKPARRCVIEYGAGDWFVKVLRRGEASRITAIYRVLASTPSPPRIAYPQSRLEGIGALIWKGVPGRPLTDLAGAAPRGSAAAGRALAELHGSGALLPERHGRRDEIQGLSRWVRAASAVYPRSRRLLAEALESVVASMHCAKTSLCASHRDFHDGQILVHESGLTLIDFDMAAMAEPELDVGNFLAHLQLQAVLNPEGLANRSRDAFMESYARHRYRLSKAALSWYRRVALVRLACVHSFRLGDQQPAWRLAELALSVDLDTQLVEITQ